MKKTTMEDFEVCPIASGTWVLAFKVSLQYASTICIMPVLYLAVNSLVSVVFCLSWDSDPMPTYREMKQTAPSVHKEALSYMYHPNLFNDKFVTYQMG